MLEALRMRALQRKQQQLSSLSSFRTVHVRRGGHSTERISQIEVRSPVLLRILPDSAGAVGQHIAMLNPPAVGAHL